MRLIGIAVACLAVLGCQGEVAQPVTPAPAVAPAVEPSGTLEEQVKRAADRELAALPDAHVVSGPGFTAEATGAAPVVTSDASGTTLTMDIGTAAPVVCTVYAEPMDPGGTFRVLSQPARRDGRSTRMLPGELSVAGERPVQRLDVLYRQEPAAGVKDIGALKMAFIGDFDRPAACSHDELGYSETFTRVVERLASSLVTSGTERPRRVEISRATFRDQPVGFDFMGEWGSEGVTGYRRTTVAFSAAAFGADFNVRDSVTRVEYDAPERLRKGQWSEATDGVLTFNLTVDRTAKGFHVSGSEQGKPVETVLKALPAGLSVPRGFDLVRQEAAAVQQPIASTRVFSRDGTTSHEAVARN